MDHRETSADPASIERMRVILNQQLDQSSTGNTVHLVANLKAAHSMAADNFRAERDADAFSIVKESEAQIRAFLAKARRMGSLFS